MKQFGVHNKVNWNPDALISNGTHDLSDLDSDLLSFFNGVEKILKMGITSTWHEDGYIAWSTPVRRKIGAEFWLDENAMITSTTLSDYKKAELYELCDKFGVDCDEGLRE